MQTYSETAIRQFFILVDVVGYSLMLVLAVTLFWGINAGIEITVSDSNEQPTQSEVTRTVISTAALAP